MEDFYAELEEMADPANKIEAIKDAIKELVKLAYDTIPVDEEGARNRAKAYWAAIIRCQLDDDHNYLGREMCTMQDTIDELRGSDEEGE